MQPFEKKWPADSADYPPEAFDEFDSGLVGKGQHRKRDGAAAMQAALENMQPDVLAATADKLDGTLNNQSLVVLFTCKGKKLLFVGDAQWGNWAYWLYGKAVTGADPGITATARDILGSIDFYKVGHHGSTNATPIPAVGALSHNCSAMCSTATGAYGSPAKKTEVPRTALIDALEDQDRQPAGAQRLDTRRRHAGRQAGKAGACDAAGGIQHPRRPLHRLQPVAGCGSPSAETHRPHQPVPLDELMMQRSAYMRGAEGREGAVEGHPIRAASGPLGRRCSRDALAPPAATLPRARSAPAP